MFKDYYRKNIIKKINDEILKKFEDFSEEKLLSQDSSVEDIMDNIGFLAKQESRMDGSIATWIPLHYKRLIFYVIYGNDARIETKIKTHKENSYTTAECTIYVKSNDTFQILTYCEKTCSYSSISAFEFPDPSERNVKMMEYAKANAERFALFYAGICMDFTGDMEDAESLKNLNIPDNQQLPLPQDLEKKFDETAASLNEVPTDPITNTESENNIPLDNAVSDEEPLDASKEKVLFGRAAEDGKKLDQVSPKYLGWMLSELDKGKESAPNNYHNLVKEMVDHSDEAMKHYNYYMGLH